MTGSISDADRKRVLDGVGEPASAYRKRIYEKGFSGTYTSVSLADVRSFAQTATAFMEHSIDANKRKDGLYHAYNLMTVTESGGLTHVHVHHPSARYARFGVRGVDGSRTLTMMIVCRDDRSATIVRDKNSMSITITRYRYQRQLQSMIIVHQRRLGGARHGRIIELSR